MRRGLATAVLGFGLAAAPAVAFAHTEPDLVAVPAGDESTITLKPTHGCGGSPTVAVRIRAPVAGATPVEVEGWTATATADEAGRTVLEWTGGVLPSDAEGAFPLTFAAPDEPGRLLTFPAIQVCESGEELAWISGDPASEFPAPRVLVLPPGYEPAETIEDVPLDAPGRDQLVAIVDVDNPQAPTTVATIPPTTASPTAPASTAPTTTVAPATSAPSTTGASATTSPTTTATTSPPTTVAAADEGGGGSAALIVGGIVVGLAAVGAGGYAISRRDGQNGRDDVEL